MITTVTGKNQVTIPATLARELDIEPGTRLDWTRTEDGALVAKPNTVDLAEEKSPPGGRLPHSADAKVNSIVAKPKPSRAQLVRQLSGRGRRCLRPGSDPIGDLIRERAQEGVAEGPA